MVGFMVGSGDVSIYDPRDDMKKAAVFATDNHVRVSRPRNPDNLDKVLRRHGIGPALCQMDPYYYRDGGPSDLASYAGQLKAVLSFLRTGGERHRLPDDKRKAAEGVLESILRFARTQD